MEKFITYEFQVFMPIRIGHMAGYAFLDTGASSSRIYQSFSNNLLRNGTVQLQGALGISQVEQCKLDRVNFLGHEFLDVTLPSWMQNAARELASSIHTLDPEQATAYGTTHVLVCVAAVERLLSLGLLTGEKPICRVVGVKQDWEDCQWVSKTEFELAKKKMMFRTKTSRRIPWSCSALKARY